MWREAVQWGGAISPLAPQGLDSGASGLLAAAEALSNTLDLRPAEGDPCFLGSAALLLMQVASGWRHGRFFTSVQAFAALHDQFLTSAHPGFYESSAWPLRDMDIRAWKDRLLYQVRRFRELVGRRFSEGIAGFSEANLPDPVERENLGSLASHAFDQRKQQNLRALRAKAALNGSAGEESHELLPHWEVPASAALLPALQSARPLPRIYVYGEADVPSVGELTRAPAFCHFRQWGADVGFHDFFRASPLRTFNPEEADYFFVPTYACCHQLAGFHDFDGLDETHSEVVRNLPYLARSGGRDHIFAFHYVDLFPSWRRHIARSVFLTPETEVGFERSRADFALDQKSFPPFDPDKDLSVPPYINMQDVLGFHHHAKPMAERQHIAAFTGKLWADVAEATDVRGRVAALARRPGFAIRAYASISDMLGPTGMQSLMGDARFCLIPRGRAAWSVRFFESLWAGCVPVLLSDHYEPPFDALFDISEFVIKWPVARIDDSLAEFLEGVPLAVVERYAAAARRVRCWYLYPPPEVSWLGSWEARYELEQVEEHVCPSLSSSRNAFQAVVEMLARRTRRTKAGAGSFYLPDPSRGYAPTVTTADLVPA